MTTPAPTHAGKRGNDFRLSEFTGAGYDKGRPRAVQALWLFCSSVMVTRWWCPARLRIALLRLFGAKIVVRVYIRHGVRVHWPWKLTIGDSSWIGEGAWLLNLEPITIGSNSCISQQVLLCTGSHDRRSHTFEFDNGPISIGDSVWVGARATVLRGVHIADGVTIGAQALIVADVPSGAVVLAPRAVRR